MLLGPWNWVSQATMSDNAEAIRERLLQLQAKLQNLSNDGSADVVELDQSRVGRLSRMDAMQAQAMAQASLARRDATLRKVAAALVRLERGEFGVCESCDLPINPKRLEFDPAATLCIDCASRADGSR